MIIANVSSEDYQQIVDIYNYYILNSTCTFEISTITVADMANRIAHITSKYPFVVLKDEEKVMGYAYIHELNEREAFNISCEISLYMAKEYTGKGLAKLLMEDMIRKAKQMSIKNIVALITSENTNSINFHYKYGFKKVGTLTDIGFKFNRYLSLDYLQLKI